MQKRSRNSRRHQRVPVHAQVRISTIDPEPDPLTGRPRFQSTSEVATNLSRGGLFLPSSQPIGPGRRVLVEMELPDGRALETLGRVAWTRTVLQSSQVDGGSGVGVEFLVGDPAELHTLEEFLHDQDLPEA